MIAADNPDRQSAKLLTVAADGRMHHLPRAALGTLFGPDRNLTYRVVQALVAIGGEAARETLVRAMDSPDASARALAAGGVIRLYSR